MSQIICPISGEILLRSDLLLGIDYKDKHPIFYAKKELILSTDTIFKFQFSKSGREKRLYYLSLLNTTDLIDFHVPAHPSAWIMESTFIRLAELAQWIDFAKYRMRERINFPRYSVREDTKEMKNISIWISEIGEIQKIFLVKNKQEDLKKELTAKAADIEREYKRASVTGAAFTAPLARWALELASVEEGVYEKWRQLLLTPLEDAWTLNREDLEEMLEHFRAELPINNDQVIAVIGQIKLLLGKSREGFSFHFIDDEGKDEDPENSRINKIFPSSSLRLSSANPEDNEPLIDLADIGPEPQRKDFAKSFLYTQAKLRWDMMRKEALGMNKLRGEYGQF